MPGRKDKKGRSQGKEGKGSSDLASMFGLGTGKKLACLCLYLETVASLYIRLGMRYPRLQLACYIQTWGCYCEWTVDDVVTCVKGLACETKFTREQLVCQLLLTSCPPFRSHGRE